MFEVYPDLAGIGGIQCSIHPDAAGVSEIWGVWDLSLVVDSELPMPVPPEGQVRPGLVTNLSDLPDRDLCAHPAYWPMDLHRDSALAMAR